jgi:hypothetical protein
MDSAEIKIKIIAIKADMELMLAQEDLEPYVRAGLESALAHVTLLYIELGLDAGM